MSTLPHTPGFGWTTRRIRRARKQRNPSTSPRVVDELPRLRAEKEFADTQAARDRRLLLLVTTISVACTCIAIALWVAP